MYECELATAIEVVREAAKLCAAVQQAITPDVLQKKDKSPVTVADFGSQALVCRRIAAAFPTDPMIAEESAAELRQNPALLEKVLTHVRRFEPAADAETVCHWIDHHRITTPAARFWTLDPIDGTKGFLRREQYAIALALVIGGQVAVAALACPNLAGPEGETGAVFTAVKGYGAFVESLVPGAAPQRLHVTATADPAGARFCESVESGHSSHSDAARIAERLAITAAPVRMDSQAKYATVARGEADIYLRLPTVAGYVEKIWDHAAGALVVNEAGGKVTDVAGNPLDFTHGAMLQHNRGVIVTNGRLHEAVLDALRELGLS